MPSLLRTPEFQTICKLDGPISPDEGARLSYLASMLPENAVIVEIGSNEGKSACFMAAGLKYAGNMNSKIYCVDLWELGGPTQQVNYRIPGKRVKFQKNVFDLGFENIIDENMADSIQFSRTWDQKIDMLFIDAGHTFDAVSADYKAWQKYIKRGGYIVFHDYKPMWPGVMQLIDETVLLDEKWIHPETVVSMISLQRR